MASPVFTGEIYAGVIRSAGASLSALGQGLRNFLRLALGTTSGRIGLPIVLAHVFVAIFGPWLAPYSPTDIRAEHQFVAPAFKQEFLSVGRFVLVAGSETLQALDNGIVSEDLRSGFDRASSGLSTLADDAAVSTVQDGSSWTITQPGAAPYEVTTIEGSERYWFGTDNFGRDVFSRILSGARSLILIALCGAVLGIFLGTVVGMGSGYKGGKVDEVLMRVVDAMMAFPGLLLTLLILVTLGARDAPWKWLDSNWEAVLIVITVGIVFLPGISRVMRSITLKAKNQEFVMSARLRGESAPYIIFREVLPNAMTVLAVELSVRLSYSILIVSSLGFLGLGVQPPSPDWGLMISESRGFLADYPWMTLAPAGAISSLVVGVNLLSDGIRQASGLPKEIPR